MHSREVSLPATAAELYEISDWTPELRQSLSLLIDYDDREVVEYFLEGVFVHLDSMGEAVKRVSPANLADLIAAIASPSDTLDAWEIAIVHIPAVRHRSFADLLGDIEEWSEDLIFAAECWLMVHGNDWDRAVRVATRAGREEALSPIKGREVSADEAVERLFKYLTPLELGQIWRDVEAASGPHFFPEEESDSRQVIDDGMVYLAKLLRNYGLPWKQISQALVIKDGPRAGQHPSAPGIYLAIKRRATN